MPGSRDSFSFHAQYLEPWKIYRSGVASNDDPDHPELMLDSVDASGLASGIAAQLWVVPERTDGTGTITITVVQPSTGSLATVRPYQTLGEAAAVPSLGERRFTGLTAGAFKILVTGIDEGAIWNIHVTTTSAVGIQVPSATASIPADSSGIVGGAGDYGGAEPPFAPESGLGVAVDTSTEQIWWYYGGAWH